MRGDDFFVELSQQPAATKLHPQVAAFLKNYFAKEKVVTFGDRRVINTNFPPYPSPAFDNLLGQFARPVAATARRLYSVTLAVTNRCPFNCWHCYNAGRSQADIPLPVLRNLAGELQDMGATMVTLTGGEPLVRADLAEIARAFDGRSCLVVGTTGDGLTPDRARELRDSGVFAVGISLDSIDETEHDRRRGRPGAFRTALEALQTARDAGLYPYVVTVVTRDLLPRDRFLPLLRFAAAAGALEVHVLEPSAAGKLAGQTDVLLTAAERRQLLAYQAEVAHDDCLPILSSFSYLESPEAFGCGAGQTHLYIDGGGEVCPCNLVPLSFGNLTHEPFRRILDRMGCHFCQPRTGCVGRQLARHFPEAGPPTTPERSEAICAQHLPRTHERPAFFRIQDEAADAAVGAPELRDAYDRVHGDYDTFWLVEAAKPVDALVARLPWTGRERVFEAGCGTGYGTAQLAARAARVQAVDLSAGMQAEARARLLRLGLANVDFVTDDAMVRLQADGRFDCVFSSWVLGYIPLAPFFAATSRALSPGGRLAFVVHRENSPREPMEIFTELVAEDPSVLLKRVAFDFPRDAAHIRSLVEAADLEVEVLEQDGIVFTYATAEQALEHLLKSGAGTAFYDALDPERRPALTARFLQLLAARRAAGATRFAVRHDYVACIARRR
jgi:MoaA/NifB/PqqE/SkfB family radical SAM enzyme/protein-L-isoaspartate O-methyltransferase